MISLGMDKISDEMLIKIKKDLSTMVRHVYPSHVQGVLEKMGYGRYRCGYLRERFWAIGDPFKNRKRGVVCRKVRNTLLSIVTSLLG